MTTPDAQHQFVFVAGLHRSGTTPLARILASHDEVSGFRDTGAREDEGQHLQNVYPAARCWGGAGRFAFAPAAHLTEHSALVEPDAAARLYGQWAPHWNLDKHFLLEKSPPNLIMTRFLQELFPGAVFVVVLRHPVVVALSTRKWTKGTSSLIKLVEHWIRAYDLFLTDAPHLRAVHTVHYEELVNAPESTLASIQQFLGLNSLIPGALVQAGLSDRYAEEWSGMRRSRSAWARWEMRGMRRRFAGTIQGFGYDLDDLSVLDTTVLARRLRPTP